MEAPGSAPTGRCSARDGIVPALAPPARAPTFPSHEDLSYRAWLWREYPRRARLAAMRRQAALNFPIDRRSASSCRCTISSGAISTQAINTVLAQTYPHFELCIADDGSPAPHIRPMLSAIAARDARIKVVFRPKNGGISAACNSALSLATGEFVAQLDHDDLLAPPRTTHQVVRAAQPAPGRGFHLFGRGQDRPRPSPQPAVFQARLEPGHLPHSKCTLAISACTGARWSIGSSAVSRSVSTSAEDYDLVLRLVERTNRIHHIPDVLYSWRMHPKSTATASTRGEDLGLQRNPLCGRCRMR